MGEFWVDFFGLALPEDSATGDGVIQIGVVCPLVTPEGIERELGVYPVLECFEVPGLAGLCLCWMKIRMDGHMKGEVGGRTQEGVDELRSVVHHVRTPKSKMSGITWMVVKGKSSDNDHPGRAIGGERGSIVGGVGGLFEKLDNFGASGVVFGGGSGGHCCKASQGRLAVSQGGGT